MYGLSVNPMAGSRRYMGVVVLPNVSVADALLIQASWDEPDRFAAVYDRYAAQLYRYAYRRVGSAAAEDVVAEAFLAAFRRRHTYDLSRPDARPWLFGILTRELGRHERAERAHYRALARSAATATPDDSPDDAVVDRVSAGAARNQLAAALAALSARDRDVLLLVAWGDFAYGDVATALGIPVGTVRSRLNRARRKVRAALDPITDEGIPTDGH
jgi:RNA polymerase sigma factor (sigma-70 family)